MSLLLSPRAPFVCSLSVQGEGEELGWWSGVAGVGRQFQSLIALGRKEELL